MFPGVEYICCEWPSTLGKYYARTSTYIGVQTDGLHGGRVVRVNTVAEGLPAATKTTTEGAVAVGVVHHWSLVVHNGKGGVVRIVSGGEGVREKREEGVKFGGR